ncbi:MAG: hypothetical protein RSD97_08890 [Lachnospiraceae bacterium]
MKIQEKGIIALAEVNGPEKSRSDYNTPSMNLCEVENIKYKIYNYLIKQLLGGSRIIEI